MKAVLVNQTQTGPRKFKSAKAAADALNVSTQTIKTWCNGENIPRDKDIIDIQWVDDNTDSEAYSQYQIDKHGRYMANASNIETWLEIHYHNRFSLNEWTDNLELDGEPVNDRLIDHICIDMDKDIGINNDRLVRQGITGMCEKIKYHPIKDKIESIKWDGTSRLDDFFIKYLGAKDTSLNRKYTRYWFMGGIKRLYQPGSMWDHMIILFDTNGGTGKTKIFERISFGHHAISPDIQNKDIINVMNQSWIVNFDELAQFDKRDMNALKTFITTRTDTNRLAYARYSKTYKRHCIFCGTTNDRFFLRDYTSPYAERRFWILECAGQKRTVKEWNRILPDSYILQVWAEALAAYREDPDFICDFTLQEKEDEKNIQANHKSFGNDPKVLARVDSILNRKYSKLASEDFDTFDKEASPSKYGHSIDNYTQVSRLDKISILWIAATLDRCSIDYVKGIITHHVRGWRVDGDYAVRDTQLSLAI